MVHIVRMMAAQDEVETGKETEMTSFALRLPDHLMDQAKAASAEDKVSINQLLASFIAEGLGHRRGLKMMKERGARANIDAALAILDNKVPDNQPDAGDELPKKLRSKGASTK